VTQVGARRPEGPCLRLSGPETRCRQLLHATDDVFHSKQAGLLSQPSSVDFSPCLVRGPDEPCWETLPVVVGDRLGPAVEKLVLWALGLRKLCVRRSTTQEERYIQQYYSKGEKQKADKSMQASATDNAQKKKQTRQRITVMCVKALPSHSVTKSYH
jgi:hypothetical protein